MVEYDMDDPYNNGYFPSKSRWMNIWYTDILQPRHIRLPLEGRSKAFTRLLLYHDERFLGGKPIGSNYYRADNICMDEGSYFEPPVYQTDIYEILTVPVCLKYWGRGLTLTTEKKEN